MVKFAGLAELARSVFHEILTNGFIGADRKHGLIRIHRFESTTILNIRGVIVLAGSAIFAPSGAQIVATILHRRHCTAIYSKVRCLHVCEGLVFHVSSDTCNVNGSRESE